MLAYVITAVIGLHSVHPVRYVSQERFARTDYASCISAGQRAVNALIAKERRRQHKVRIDIVSIARSR
jgi:hypothetical protein